MKRIATVSLFTVVICAVLAPAAAHAQCSITGVITAAPSGDPMLPEWEYTLVVTWDTGSMNALSHLDLLLDPVGGTCSCQDFQETLVFVNPASSSDGDVVCTVPYDAILECSGDPSIPGVDGILLKFEPDESLGCIPGVTGVGTFVFYSDQPPVPVDEDVLSLVDKFALDHCFGNLTGEFPGMACNPVPNTGSTWGGLKGEYR